MEKEYLLVPVDTKESFLLDFGAAGIRALLQAMDEALAWLRDARKTANLTVISMLNNGLRMAVNIRVVLTEHSTNQDNIYFGSMESLAEHCGVKLKPGWTQALNDDHNNLTLMPNGSVRLSTVPQSSGNTAPVSVEIPSGFFANVRKRLEGK